MAEITAQAVNEFRKRTGLGLMECKKLLQEADGDLKQAETLAKERGLKKAEARAGRAATAGRVEVALASDGRSGAIVELNCETDFVARNEDFRKAAAELAAFVLESDQTGVIDASTFKDKKISSTTVGDFLIDLNSRTGENVQFTRAARLAVDGPGLVDTYIHHDYKSGALVALKCDEDPKGNEAVANLAKDLALHVVASRPIALTREEVDEATVAEQRRIFKTQAAEKPENIQDKIADGKLNAWFGEIVLLDQVFVKDPSKKVSDVAKEAGVGIEVVQFARLAVGETAE